MNINDMGINELRLAVHELRRYPAEVDRLQPIVDKLPKCWRLNDAGELVQDMPVVPNEHYWIILRAGVVRILVTSIEFGGAGWWVSDSTGEGYDPSDLFSTREAAEKAGKDD